MPKAVRLSDIVGALELADAETHHYVDLQTGEVVMVSDDDFRAAEDEDEDEDRPDWQQEVIELARVILEDESGDGDEARRFVPLPDQFEIDEWQMMERFTIGVEDRSHAQQLTDAIHGRGAFRCFKDTVQRLGLAEKWYAYRYGQYEEIAREFCSDNGIELTED